jgi:hypothetical protein
MESLVEEDDVIEYSELTIRGAELFNEMVTVGKNANAVPEVPEEVDVIKLSAKLVDEGVDAETGGNGHQ